MRRRRVDLIKRRRSPMPKNPELKRDNLHQVPKHQHQPHLHLKRQKHQQQLTPSVHLQIVTNINKPNAMVYVYHASKPKRDHYPHHPVNCVNYKDVINSDKTRVGIVVHMQILVKGYWWRLYYHHHHHPRKRVILAAMLPTNHSRHN